MNTDPKGRQKLIDHLFRHQSGKMVASLVRVFGLSNLELIEDAVQDTFIKAIASWQIQMPDNPEGWLMRASKNRAIDLLRSGKIKSEHLNNIPHGTFVDSLDQMFSQEEIEDSQLRMIFTACHPSLSIKEQIAFALKTVTGFGDREISAALLTKVETVKKRLSRARKIIQEKNIRFDIPAQAELNKRLGIVNNVLYLIFNEGYHSSSKTDLIRRDLCLEAVRLCQIILKNEKMRNGETYALYSIFCFLSAKIPSKISNADKLVDLKNQDRKKWNPELIMMGNMALGKAMDSDVVSNYHLEAAILGEHLNAPSFEETNWENILEYYETMFRSDNSALLLLNIAFVLTQMNLIGKAKKTLAAIHSKELENRIYLYYGLSAELHYAEGNIEEAVEYIDLCLSAVSNTYEKEYLLNKRNIFTASLN